MMATDWKVYIDWDNDGFGTADDISAYVMQADWNIGLGDGDELTAGEQNAQLVLKNDDKRFSPEYASGPYYGKFLPKRRMQIRGVDASLGTVVKWTGYFERIEPQSGENREKQAILRGLGPKSYLERHNFYPELLVNVTADDVIEQVFLDTKEFPPGMELGFTVSHPTLGTVGNVLPDHTTGINFQTGQNTFPFVGDTWGERTTAYQAIADVVRGERGRFFFDRGGTAIFWNRKHLQSLYIVQGTIANPIAMDYEFGNIVNEARLKVRPRTISSGSSETLWELDETISIPDGSEKVIRANFGEVDKELEISGRNFQPPSFTFSRPRRWVEQSVEYSARSAKITLRNNGGRDQELTAAAIYGQKITSNRTQTIEREDADSTMLYGKRSVTIDTGLMNDLDLGIAVAAYESKRKAQPIGIAKSVTIRNGRYPASQMLGYSMGTVLNVSDAQLAHDSEYVIVGERHSVRQGMKLHDATYVLSPISQNKTLLVSVTGRNELDGTNVVGY